MPPRRTHDYPGGKPGPIVLVELGLLVVVIFWVIFGWRRPLATILILAAFVALGIVYSKLHQHYQQTGAAVPRRGRNIDAGRAIKK